MGCDIHIVVERRRKVAEPWVGVFSSAHCPGSRPPVAQRDYDFFSAVANVRGQTGEYRNYPKNVPEDIGQLAWQEYMSAPTDHHSVSHMTAEEFCAVHHKVNPTQSRAEHAVYDLLGLWLNEPEDVEYRVVFWFDN